MKFLSSVLFEIYALKKCVFLDFNPFWKKRPCVFGWRGPFFFILGPDSTSENKEFTYKKFCSKIIIKSFIVCFTYVKKIIDVGLAGFMGEMILRSERTRVY